MNAPRIPRRRAAIIPCGGGIASRWLALPPVARVALCVAAIGAMTALAVGCLA